MSPPLLLLGLRLVGVVDRVEGPMAVVEWRADCFGDLPLSLLPGGTGEGDQLLFDLDLHERGALLALEPGRALVLLPGRPSTLNLPVEAQLRPGLRYELRVQRSPSRPRQGAAIRPPIPGRAAPDTTEGEFHDHDG